MACALVPLVSCLACCLIFLDFGWVGIMLHVGLGGLGGVGLLCLGVWVVLCGSFWVIFLVGFSLVVDALFWWLVVGLLCEVGFR